MERHRAAQLQVAGTSFFALFSIVGIALYGLPFFYDFFVKEFGWTRAEVTSGNAFGKIIVGPIFGFAAGYMIDKFGPRRLMMTGIVMAGGALIGLSLMSGIFWVFYLCYLFNALGYVCGGPLPNQVLLSRWFDKSRGKAMGFAYVGIGLGGAFALAVAPWLIENIGWRGALRILGILMIVIPMPMAYFVKESPDEKRERDSARPPMAPIGHLFRNPAFYLLAFGSFLSIGALGGTMQNLKLYLSMDMEFTQKAASNVGVMILVFSIAGRLLMGWLADRMHRKHVMMIIYFVDACALPFLFFADSELAIFLFALLFGLGLGGEYMIIPLMAADLFGVKVLGRLMGIILTADGVAEAVTPMVVAKLRDVTGSYNAGFTLLIVLSFLGLLVISLLPKQRQAGADGQVVPAETPVKPEA